jgi:hypothetical protein
MAKTIALILGVVFILVGLAGFAAPNLLGAHLSTTHNIIHLVSGVVSLYFGWMGSLSGAKMFGIIFGAVYGLLGVVGFLMGTGADRMWDVIPGSLMLGTMDHVIHLLLGAIYLIGAFLTKTGVASAAD